jgi:nucleotide-binding universal stress UspA family protein
MTSQSLSQTHNVILAIDGSEHAMAAVNLLQNLSLPDTCKITVLSVLIPHNAQYFASLENILEHTRNLFLSIGKDVNTKLLTGYPAEQIIRFANEQNADMIVLGAKGLRGTIRILLGGVAQQVVEYAQCPVLIARAPHIDVKRVLLVTDGTEYSKYAIEHLGICPIPESAAISVMHVLPPELTPDMLIRSWPYGIDALPPVLSSDIDESLAMRTAEEGKIGEELLKSTVDHLCSMNIQAEPILKRGDAATEILSYAHENHIDLIIAGSRGLSQIRNLLLGSVSSKLTHYAECSVLIVKKTNK